MLGGQRLLRGGCRVGVVRRQGLLELRRSAVVALDRRSRQLPELPERGGGGLCRLVRLEFVSVDALRHGQMPAGSSALVPAFVASQICQDRPDTVLFRQSEEFLEFGLAHVAPLYSSVDHVIALPLVNRVQQIVEALAILVAQLSSAGLELPLYPLRIDADGHAVLLRHFAIQAQSVLHVADQFYAGFVALGDRRVYLLPSRRRGIEAQTAHLLVVLCLAALFLGVDVLLSGVRIEAQARHVIRALFVGVCFGGLVEAVQRGLLGGQGVVGLLARILVVRLDCGLV